MNHERRKNLAQQFAETQRGAKVLKDATQELQEYLEAKDRNFRPIRRVRDAQQIRK